ncbi:hypothetical protein QWY14_15685 [Planococcus sp. N028]|uniref:Uncharacterized protein n=1 Tax=Planococcus shixiaomingii TaxID=3058393 RepID=A0ABT8N5T3_9BACL|nr:MULTISPECIES: hypothetical protein [unclassified Planococcus (in: firmicutes)]MDN7243246.1 hypothetical protein [Planococcus sp. N028]WKA55188.1 hypothetical protein QWY21_02050 [Planococcus sp. N022]
MNHTGKRMTDCEEYLYILHGVFFTGVAARDKSVLFQTTAWSENNQ